MPLYISQYHVKSYLTKGLPTATLLLWFFAFGCTVPAFRVDGKLDPLAGSVSILPQSATTLLDSLLEAHTKAIASLENQIAAKRDSLSSGGKGLEADLEKARGRARSAREAYFRAFEGIRRFRSFGGNAIYSNEDRGIGTKKLLQEISDRFYKGKAFSLETETELRAFIRSRLVLREKKLMRARSSLNRIQRSKGGNTEELEQLEKDYALARRGLVAETNGKIVSSLENLVMMRTRLDSVGNFTFSQLPSGRYYLYAPYPLPKGWLVPIHLDRHRRQELGPVNACNLLVIDVS